MHFNLAILSGNLGADPELKFTSSGTPVCNMRLATNRRYVDASGNQQERTDWHRIVVFGKQAEACAKHLKKGRLIGVEGEIRTRSYEDKDKVTRHVVEIVASRVKFGPRGSNAPAKAGEPTETGPVPEPEGAPAGEVEGESV